MPDTRNITCLFQTESCAMLFALNILNICIVKSTVTLCVLISMSHCNFNRRVPSLHLCSNNSYSNLVAAQSTDSILLPDATQRATQCCKKCNFSRDRRQQRQPERHECCQSKRQPRLGEPLLLPSPFIFL